MEELRMTMAVEAAAKALHEAVRRGHQPGWDLMSETWRNEMREYVRPCVLATLKVADAIRGSVGKASSSRRPIVQPALR
jgi:hypothetical protein